MLVFLLFALVSAQGGPIQPCTTTTSIQARCCPPDADHTTTQSVECNGCGVLVTTTTGINCAMVCPTPAFSTTSGTSTIAVCKKSPPCWITATEPLRWGCNIRVPKATFTHLSDCSGCGLSTTTVNYRGIGPQCVSGRQTVTEGVTTVTKCRPSPNLPTTTATDDAS